MSSCNVDDIDYSQDLIWSCIGGGLMSATIIVVLQYFPGEPFDYTNIPDDKEDNTDEQNLAVPTVDDKELLTSAENPDVTVEQVLDGMTEESVLHKTEHVRKAFGISEDTIRKAVRKTKEDAKKGISEDTELFSWPALLNAVVWGASILGILYLFNDMTNGEVYRICHGLFRSEFEAMNMPLPS